MAGFSLVVGALYAFTAANERVDSWPVPEDARPALERGLAIGPSSGEALTVFVDYDCESCHDLIANFVALAKEREAVRMVVKQLPNEQSAHSSLTGAIVAACAGEQGAIERFSQYAAERQGTNGSPIHSVEIAHNIGVSDTTAFRLCISEGGGLWQVRQDQQEAARAGIERAPAVVYDGTAYQGRRAVRQLHRILR
ncbi:MAG: thioredoxin domain-containing protein [Gemmatimonadota bacterium]